jgi:molecular chaperone IbpA
MTYMQTQYDPFTTVGFDRIFERIQAMHQPTDRGTQKYPPYNITKESDTTYIVEMAVAGFTDDSLDIQVKEGVLTVEGKVEDSTDKEYIHRGIAARAFTRTFTLAETVIVKDAGLENGMLRILLENVIPEEQKPKKIKIGQKLYSGEKELLQE